MWGTNHGIGMGFGGFGIILWIVILIAVIAVARSMFSNTTAGTEEPSAREILKRRLATGEISEEEYQRLKKQIEKED